MISWLVSTTAVATTEYLSTHDVQTTSVTRTANLSITDAYFGGGSTSSFTSSESGSGSTIRATITSANESALFGTTSTSVIGAFGSASGETVSYTFSDTSANTVFYNSGSAGGPTSTSFFATGSTLRFTFSIAKQTSSTETTSAIVFGPLSSSLSSATNAVTQTASSAVSLSTVSQTSFSVTPESATTSITTSVPTTTQAPFTYWFFPSTSEAATQTTTTTFGSETFARAYATVCQAAANEVIYLISSPTSFAWPPVAARELASTFTRVTVTPVAVTLSRESTIVAQISDATTTESVATDLATTRTIVNFGPDGESSTFESQGDLTTTTSSVAGLNYELSSTAQDETNPYTSSGFSQTEYLRNSGFRSYGAARYANDAWFPFIVTPASPLTSQNRFGKSGWDIGGQKGSELTPSTLPFDVNEFSGSISRGRKTVFNTTRSDITIDAPSVTYRTTIGSDTTTASILLGVSGSMELIGDNAGNIEHLGGGGYAESWTVVDRVYPDHVYSDMVNSGTTSYLGDDTSYSGTSRRSVSHLTFEPYLYSGGPDGTTTPDAIFWTEYRNPESEQP